MREIDPALLASLEGGATTLARCWKLTRSDGVVLGFTDHDRTLVVNGVSYAAQTGLEAADAQSQLGLAVGAGDVAGVLAAASLTELDLAAGRYDDATVDILLVDWEDPSRSVLIDSGTLGEVRRAGAAFTAEVRSVAHRLDQESGRLFQKACTADLGDERCGLDLAAHGLVKTAAVLSTDGAGFLRAVELAGQADGWFTGGRLTFGTGANAGLSVEVRTHRQRPDAGELTLWHPMPSPVANGDTFTVGAGCDKAFATCRDRFANEVNFRGFPHMPGNDFLLRIAQEGVGGMDGGVLVP